MALLSRYADQENTTSSCIVGQVQKAEWQQQRSTFTHTLCGHDAIRFIIVVRSLCKRIFSPYAKKKSKPHLTLKNKKVVWWPFVNTTSHTQSSSLLSYIKLHLSSPDLHWLSHLLVPRPFCNIWYHGGSDDVYIIAQNKWTTRSRALLVVQSRHLSYAQHNSNLVATSLGPLMTQV